MREKGEPASRCLKYFMKVVSYLTILLIFIFFARNTLDTYTIRKVLFSSVILSHFLRPLESTVDGS